MFVRFLKKTLQLDRNMIYQAIKLLFMQLMPCPVAVKEEMIDWWGPIIHEYYAGTNITDNMINSAEWLEHKGSVGRPLFGSLHILDDGEELPTGEVGGVYFGGETATTFEYHNDEEKTKSAMTDKGYSSWRCGLCRSDGFLYLTDRKSFMIISGGVNIYQKKLKTF